MGRCVAYLMAALAYTGSCAREAPAAPPPSIERPRPVAAASENVVTATLEDRRCTSDRECTLTTVECCGCQSLGANTGVRKDRLASLAERRTPTCAATNCAMAMSQDPTCSATRAVCRDGLCVPNVGRTDPPPGGNVEPIPE